MNEHKQQPFDPPNLPIRAPNGETRWLKHTWSILAYQIAGDEGLRLLHAEGEVAERASAPAKNLLLALLRVPEERGEPTLLLIDEVLMYAREKVGLAQARENMRRYLGWEEVRKQLQKQEIREQDPIRWEIHLRAARNAVPGAIRQAYTVVVTMSEQGDTQHPKTVEAFRVKVEERALFSTIKADRRARIQETTINAEALLPGGPYALWAEGETARWLKDLVGAFAKNPRLPKMLNRRAILETLVQGCAEGRFVLRLQTADAAPRTFWRTRPPAEQLDNPAMEVALPEAGTWPTSSARATRSRSPSPPRRLL